MTMSKSQKTIPAGEFKARCLALLDEVAQTGMPLLVTKRGKAVARLVPVEEPPGLLHSVKKEKDLVSPIGEAWDATSR
jgi:prevent-host-death family protein